jgi:outer membrane protein OmpA-like peptidoglycan-associated protein
MKLISAVAFSLLSLTLASASRADVKYFPLEKSPTPIEFARSLMGANFKPATKLRGLRPVVMTAEGAQAANAVMSAQETHAPETKLMSPVGDASVGASDNALAVPIPFGFNSARLVEIATKPLDDIAEGIKLIHTTANVRVVIEGHTDANGSAAYNLKLSQWRAVAVKRYLVAQHQIDPSLLVAKGFGQSAPLNKTNRFADENRRVQFRVS